MFQTKLKTVIGLLLLAGTLGAGAGILQAPAAAGPKEEGKLRQEIDRLQQTLNKLQEQLTALEARLGPADVKEVRFKGKPAGFWVQALKDRAPSYRMEALEALGAIAEVEPRLIPALAGALKDPDGNMQAAAARALARLGKAAEPAVPALLEALRNKKTLDKAGAAFVEALAAVGPAAVRPVAELLKDPDTSIRTLGVITLHATGQRAAVPLLVGALKDPDQGVRTKAVESLGWMGVMAKEPPAEAVPALVDLMKKEAALRLKVIEALGRIKAGAKTAVPALADLLKKPDPDVQYAAVKALAEFGPAARPAVPALAAAFRGEQSARLHGYQNVRRAAADVLARLDPVAAAKEGVEITRTDAIPLMREALKDKDPEVRAAAAWGLGTIARAGSFSGGEMQAAAVPARTLLIDALGDPHPDVRLWAAKALEGLAWAARPAVPALRRARQDEDASVREAAAKALQVFRSTPSVTP